jgi:hypothetical protein
MSEILGSQITIENFFIKEAILLNFKGYSWMGLEMLGVVAALVYKQVNKAKELDRINALIIKIKKESETITGASAETRLAKITDYLNSRAKEAFTEEVGYLRDYRQDVGYYSAMNKGWTDPSGGRKSE